MGPASPRRLGRIVDTLAGVKTVFATALLPVALLAAGGSAGACPPSDVGSIATDPTVTAAFEQAWKDSQEGSPGEHEEGGWIYHCSNVDPSAPASFATIVERWPKGKTGEITPSPLSKDSSCRLVGSFHTHPGPASGHPKNDGYTNEKPSAEDLATGHDDGVAGFIIFGEGTDPADSTVVPYGPEEATTPCPPPDVGPDPSTIEGIGESAGDPHLETFDGYGFEFQASGEFVLVRGDDRDLEIQSRQEPAGSNTHATVNTGFAIRIDGAVIEVSDDRLVVDGEARELQATQTVTTPSGGVMTGGPGSLRFEWSDGTVAEIVGHSIAIRLVPARTGKVAGILGDADGDQKNDLTDAAGTPLLADGRLDFADRYERLAPTWQVDDETSLFSYEPGTSPATFARDDIPGFGLYADHFDSDARDAAEQACRDAGLEGARRIQNCALDVAVTGDTSLASEARRVEQLVARWRAEVRTDPPLVTAARNGELAVVQRLLADGAAADAIGRDGITALHAATFAADVAIVDALLAAGADPDAADDDGATALHIAATFGLEPIARALLAAGADPTIVDDFGRTPADAATEQGNPALARLLG